MANIAKITLHLGAVVLILAFGYVFPNALATTLSWLDSSLGEIAAMVDPTGVIKLVFQFAGAGFIVLLASLVLALGMAGRKFVSRTFFRMRRVLTASLIPLFAHAVKWGLGIWWPALLVPVQQLADYLISQLTPTTQVTMGLFNARGHLMTVIIGFALLLTWSLIVTRWRREKRRQSTPPTQRKWKLVTWPFRLSRKWRNEDVVLNPISWTITQFVLAFLVAYIISLILWLVGNLGLKFDYLVQNPFTGKISTAITVGLTIIFCLPTWKEKMIGEGDSAKKVFELEIFTVPGPAKGAQISWLGMVSPFVLATGKYLLLGRCLGFDWFPIRPRVRGSLIEPRTMADNDGFVILGDITFQVWQSPSAESKAERTSITIQAGNGGTVSGNLSYILGGRRRVDWAKADDSGLQVGNRGRQELQEVLERFVDTDVKSIQGEMGRLLRGQTMLTAFLPVSVEGRKRGSMIRDVNGKPIYVFVNEDLIDDAAQELQVLISNTGDPRAKSVLHKKDNGVFSHSEVRVTEPITLAIEERGFFLKEVIYDNIRASKEVEDASNTASSEEKQREAQMESARTNKAVRQELLPTTTEKNDPNYELRTILAAAQDNPRAARVIHLTGGNELTRSVIGAGIVNEKETDDESK